MAAEIKINSEPQKVNHKDQLKGALNALLERYETAPDGREKHRALLEDIKSFLSKLDEYDVMRKEKTVESLKKNAALASSPQKPMSERQLGEQPDSHTINVLRDAFESSKIEKELAIKNRLGELSLEIEKLTGAPLSADLSSFLTEGDLSSASEEMKQRLKGSVSMS